MKKIDLIHSVKDMVPVERPAEADLERYIKLHSFDRSRVPKDDDTILFLQGIPIGSRENLVSITGRSKSRKTIAASAIATSIFLPKDGNHLGFSSLLGPDEPLLHIDTEQGYKHYYHSVMRIFDDAGLEQTPESFTSVHTRDADIPFRIQIIEYLVKKLKPKVLVIDGVTDLVYDINSQEEATKLGEMLLKWGTAYQMLIIVVIHTTKTTGYMTGALGTVLEKKSETVLMVELDKGDRMASHITCQYSRNAPFSPFSIVADEDGKYSILPESEVATTTKRKGDKNPRDYQDMQHDHLISLLLGPGKKISASNAGKALQQHVKSAWNGEIMSGRESKDFLAFYKMRGWLAMDPDLNFILGVPVLPVEPGSTSQTSFKLNDDLPF